MRSSRSSSISSVSSSSSTPSEDTHHIFVKLLSGETIPLTIPSSTPITHLQHLLSLRTSAPVSSIRLIHAGRHLTASTPSSSIPPTTLPETATTPPSPTQTISSHPSTLSTLSIPRTATLHLTQPILGGGSDRPGPGTSSNAMIPPAPQTPQKKKPRANKCTFKDCKAASQRIVGDCSFCQGHFCGNHRMLEDHQCGGLEDCKAEAHERNREVLEGGRTVALRGI